MAGHFHDGIGGTCTVTGTATYGNIQPLDGFSPFSVLDDGTVVACTVRTPTIFESGLYIKGGGLTPSLTRSRIFRQINRSADAVIWPSNSVVTIVAGISAEDVAALTQSNAFEAAQYLLGHLLGLSPDGTSGLQASSNGRIDLLINSALHSFWGKGGSNENIQTLQWSDNGATAGPIFRLDRISASATVGDLLAYMPLSGRDDAGATVDYGGLYARILSAVAGSALGEVGIRALAGASGAIDALLIGGSLIRAYAGITSANNGITVGKSGLGLGNYGIELLSNGQIASTTNNLDPISTNRNGGDGNILAVYRDGVFKRAIRIDAGVLSFSGALYTHPTKLQGRPEDETRPVGTVLCSVDELLDDGDDIHPLTRVSTKAADPCVYGVWWRREKETGYVLAGGGGSGLIRAVGPVAHGDLLESSDIPGVARAQTARPRWWQLWRRGRADRVLRASTVAKARGSVPAGQERTIPCTLLAG